MYLRFWNSNITIYRIYIILYILPSFYVYCDTVFHNAQPKAINLLYDYFFYDVILCAYIYFCTSQNCQLILQYLHFIHVHVGIYPGKVPTRSTHSFSIV